MRRERITERENPASSSLDTKSTPEILRILNREDCKVAPAVGKVIPQIARAVELAAAALAQGGRLVYVGAGTSGRLGVLDAAECVPTFGTDRVVGVMAGGPRALYRSREASEDDPRLAVSDMKKIKVNRRDVVVGISASGRTPYTQAALRYARSRGARTVALTSNPRAELCRLADVAIVPVVGPEALAGSTRLKAGTAQKLALNMISTAALVRSGRVLGNWMVNLQLRNEKLMERARGILVKLTGATARQAARRLEASGRRLPVAILMGLKNISRRKALGMLGEGKNIGQTLRLALAKGSCGSIPQAARGVRGRRKRRHS